jgi:hypothetical protein
MGWAIGYDERHRRDIGYGVPAICDHPDCNEEIDRGLAYVCCDSEPYGGGRGCGLFFCGLHHPYCNGKHSGMCERYAKRRQPFKPKPDTLKWLYFKMTDPSWEEWRKENGLVPDNVDECGSMLGFETGLGYGLKVEKYGTENSG